MQINPRPLPVTLERCLALGAGGAEWAAYVTRSGSRRAADLGALVAELRQLGRTVATVPPASAFAESIPLGQPAEWYRSPAAVAIADAIVSFQAPSGGWSKNIDFSQHARAPGEHFSLNRFDLGSCFEQEGALASKSWHFVSTFDNDATTAQIRFLDRVIRAGGAGAAERYAASARKGVECVLEAQYPNGGWPQVWPLEGGYHDGASYNDGAIANNLALLLDLTAEGAEFPWLPPARQAAARAALEKGLRGVLETQGGAAGRKSGWCQQYDPITLAPSAGRSYEMAALASSESAGVLDVLMRLERPSPAIVAAIESGVGWLKAVAIPDLAGGDDPGRIGPRPLNAKTGWARFYDVETFQPLFGDRDRSIHQDLSQVSNERRGGYLWYSRAPWTTLKAHAKWRVRQKLA